MTRALRVAVVGGGVFGATTAVELARRGHRVDLFERSDDLLTAASGINQYRLHRGYHYPRSPETTLASMRAEASFRAWYGGAVVDDFEHYYAISRRDSLTSPEQYLRHCESLGLEYEVAAPPALRSDAVALSLRVRESLFDPAALRARCWQLLDEVGVSVHTGRTVRPADVAEHDAVVVATYAALNGFLAEVPVKRRRYQFEVCEKPVVSLPATFAGRSVVIMDGPFMCVDPFGRTGNFVLGNVVEAIHHANIGEEPDVPESLRPLLNRGVIPNPPGTRVRAFVESAREFFSGVERAQHLGSMFTVRAVLPNTDDTDERPTMVTRLSQRIAAVFSGKIVTCVDAARQVACTLESESPAPTAP